MATKERAWKGKEPLGEVRQPRLDDFEESQTCSKELLDGGSTNPSIMANDLKNISEATLCRKNTIKISLADSVSEENPYYNYSLGANNPTEKFPSDR